MTKNEALELCDYLECNDASLEAQCKAAAFIREALAQPEQELEYCMDYHCAGDCGQPHNQKEMQTFLVAQPEQEPVATLFGTLPVYDTTPPKRPWVGLTHQQTKECVIAWDGNDAYYLCRAIEAKLKEKNAP